MKERSGIDPFQWKLRMIVAQILFNRQKKLMVEGLTGPEAMEKIKSESGDKTFTSDFSGAIELLKGIILPPPSKN